jgi:hypothetical protein
MCQMLNKAFDLDSKKRLVHSTVYRAYKDGIDGKAPKIQH